MRSTLWLFLLLTPSLAKATPPFEDAFFAYANARKLEQQVALLPTQSEAPAEDRLNQTREIEASLTEARIAFHAVLRTDRAKLDPWEFKLLQQVADKKPTGLKNLDEEHLRFLEASFPEAQTFSPLEWTVIGEWFGQPTKDAFLRWSFHVKELAAAEESPKKAKLLFLSDPFVKKSAKALPAGVEALRRAGQEVEMLPLSAFTRVDDLAEELHHVLSTRESRPAVLVTEGNAAAVVLRMIDLYPRMRRSPALLGWVNVDGRLFGEKAKKASGRGLASVNAADRIARENAATLDGLRWEGLERPTPMGDGFPIVNLVTAGKKSDLREALVTDAETWEVKGAPYSKVGAVLSGVFVAPEEKP